MTKSAPARKKAVRISVTIRFSSIIPALAAAFTIEYSPLTLYTAKGRRVSSLAFATVVNMYCPSWLTSLIFASIALIVICTLAGQLLAICTIIRQLLLPVYQKNSISEGKQLTYTRLIAFAYGFLTIIPTFMIQQSFLNQITTVLIACVTGPMFFALVAGMFWKRMNTKAAAWSILSGIAVGIIWVLVGMSDSWHPVYIILPVSSAVGFIVCKVTSGKELRQV